MRFTPDRRRLLRSAICAAPVLIVPKLADAMLRASNLAGFGYVQSRVPAELSFLQTASDSDNLSSYSFTSHNFGAADSTREIICCVHWYSVAGADLSSATIGGIAATIHVNNIDDDGSARMGCAIISAAVPSGTSGTVALSFSAGCLGAFIGTYRTINLASTTAYDTDLDDGDVLTMSVNIPANGILVAGGTFGDTGTVSTTGVTEDYDTNFESNIRIVGGSATGLEAETGRSVTFNGPSTPNREAGAAASWR